MKICSSCKELKKVECFNKQAKTKDGFTTSCKECLRAKAKLYRENNIKAGKCAKCPNTKLLYSNKCLYHWVFNLVDLNARTKKLSFSLDKKRELTSFLVNKLIEQDYKCFYSAVPLTPGINCSLEHLEAYSLNNNFEKENLVWIDYTLNHLKGKYGITEAMEKFFYYVKTIKELA